jgi:hypothetical protein
MNEDGQYDMIRALLFICFLLLRCVCDCKYADIGDCDVLTQPWRCASFTRQAKLRAGAAEQ